MKMKKRMIDGPLIGVFVMVLFVFLGFITIYLLLASIFKQPDAVQDSCDIGEECFSESGVHIHADFKMFINGSELYLYVPENLERDNCTHFHESSENVIHVHCADITIGDFLKSIDAMKYLDGRNVLIVVNEHSAYYDTVIEDMDKILITDARDYYMVLNQFDSIGDLAKEASDETK